MAAKTAAKRRQEKGASQRLFLCQSEAAQRGPGVSPGAHLASPTGAQGIVRYTAPTTERSEMNFHLVQPRAKYYSEIQRRIEKAQKENPKCKVRKDSVKY